MGNLSSVVVILGLLSVHVISTEFTSSGRQQHAEGHNHRRSTLEALSQKLLLSMGLEKPPNIQNSNISTDEYDRMFRVYQTSVEQTRLLTDLREAVEDEDKVSLLDQKIIHLEPSEHTRRRRSAFEYTYSENSIEHGPAASVDETSLFLSFKSKKLTPDERIFVVDSAALHVTLVRTSSEELDASNEDGSFITLILFQLTEEQGPETGIIVEKIQVNANELGTKKTITFDVSPTVQSWVMRPRNNHGFQVVCLKCEEARISFDDMSSDTGLDVNGHKSNLGSMWKRVGYWRRSPDKDHPNMHHKHNANGHSDCKQSKPGSKKSRCCRSSMIVETKDIPGFEFVQQPTSFDAYVCMGRCPPRYNPTNIHSLLQSLMNLKTQKLDKANRIPRPCCTPSKMEPLDILHIDENDPTRLRVTHWKDVIVAECSCA